MSRLARRFRLFRRDTGPELPAINAIVTHESTSNSNDSIEKDVAVTTVIEVKPETELEANIQLKKLEKKHRWDANLPRELADGIDDATAHHDVNQELKLVDQLVENSPYPEVRAAVRNFSTLRVLSTLPCHNADDLKYDEDVPANTIRAWTLGLLLATIGSALNMLFSMRAPQLIITSLVAQLVSYPLGCAWTKVMPSRRFRLFGKEFSLNPGPFNMKEHTVIVVMANCTFGGGVAYSTDTILAQRSFYGQNWGWGFELLLTISTQCVGYGIAGLMRKFLVSPAAMIWPQNLVSTSVFYALHDHSRTDPSKSNGWSVSRYRFFFYVSLGSFVWYWFPGYLAQFLSVFAFVTWIRPNSVVINQLFGGWTGVSLIPITFDWTQVTGYVSSPLVAPFHAIGNTLIGIVVFWWLTTIGLHYSGHWYADYLPISDSSSYDNTASVYNVSKILTPEYTLDLAKYKAYSPLFLSTTFSLTYGLSFATIAAVIVHTALFHGKDIYARLRTSKIDEEDIHTRMMRKYPEAPDWWYGVLLVVMLALSLTTILAYPTHLAWWAFAIAVIIALVWTIPIGIVQATTNIQIGLNVFTEFIISYMQPGSANSIMVFKTYGYITMVQGIFFIQDLKLGHYMKIPPKIMFNAQVIATIWSCFVQIAVLEWALGSIKDICKSDQVNHFTCPNGRVFFNASIIWGVIGAQRIFSPGSIYSSLLWFWLVGALTPVAIYIAARLFPKSNIRFLSAPIIFGGTGQIPPATPLNYLSWSIIGWFFNKYIKSRYRGWWMRFNYLTSAGLDVGLALSTIVIILALNLTNTAAPSWWGNDAPAQTMDYLGTAVQKIVPDGEFFGPRNW